MFVDVGRLLKGNKGYNVGNDGKKCDKCGPGQEPSANKSGCLNCDLPFYSENGIKCKKCYTEHGFTLNSEQSTCTAAITATAATATATTAATAAITATATTAATAAVAAAAAQAALQRVGCCG